MHRNSSFNHWSSIFHSYHRRTKSGLAAQGLHYKFVPRKTGLAVRLTWPEKSPTGRYRLHLCRGARDCLAKPMNANSHDVVVRKTSYEFPRLEYDTKYTVGLRHSRRRPVAPIASPKDRKQRQVKMFPGAAEFDNVRTFVTPKCDHFRKAHPEQQVECSAWWTNTTSIQLLTKPNVRLQP